MLRSQRHVHNVMFTTPSQDGNSKHGLCRPSRPPGLITVIPALVSCTLFRHLSMQKTSDQTRKATTHELRKHAAPVLSPSRVFRFSWTCSARVFRLRWVYLPTILRRPLLPNPTPPLEPVKKHPRGTTSTTRVTLGRFKNPYPSLFATTIASSLVNPSQSRFSPSSEAPSAVRPSGKQASPKTAWSVP